MAGDQVQDYEKAARSAVNSVLAVDSSPKKAAAAISMQISSASRHAKDTRAAVTGACRGGMGAALMAGVDLPEAAVLVLESLANMSLMTRVSPEELMSWVMEGIAGVAPLARPDQREAIQNRIDEKFMGAGQVFYSFMEAALKKD